MNPESMPNIHLRLTIIICGGDFNDVGAAGNTDPEYGNNKLEKGTDGHKI